MTAAEKASQMVSGQSAPIPRLGVAGYGWWNESLHGVSRMQLNPTGSTSLLFNTTSYPANLALGSTWDPNLTYLEGTSISDEAREIAPENALDLDFFAPTVNLARDPRWGRNDETYSEDPLLTAAMAAQYVNGMEGKDQHGRLLSQGGGYLKTITTLKHYAANNSEFNRFTGSSDMDERTLREYYTAPFRLIIRDSDPGALMAAFNGVNGVPASASDHLLDTLARRTFGFGGYVTSDCDAIDSIVSYRHWRPAGWSRRLDETEAHALANAAGTDLDCTVPATETLTNRTLLPAAVNDGIRTKSDIYNVGDVDNSLVRLFTARMKLGEFDRVAGEPWVRAARTQVAPGTWSNTAASQAVTETPARIGLARTLADRSLVLLKNAPTTRRDGTVGALLPLHVPRSGPFKVAVIGSLANDAGMYLGGYSSTQGPAGTANEVTPYEGIRRAIQAIDPDAAVDFYDGFTRGGTAASLLNIDPAAVAATAGYDYVIVYAGTDGSTAAERHDRISLALPGAQAQLIAAVAAGNPNTIAVMDTIGQVDLGGFENAVPAMVWSSYNGERTGDGLADGLLGKYDPSGHLPFTWYATGVALPSIADYGIRPAAGNRGRTYMYYGGPVDYAFGHGLSYTTFNTSNLRIDRPVADANDSVKVRLQVTNTGPVSGRDLVQLYVTSPQSAAGLQPQVKRLEGFQQIALSPGQTKNVTLTVRVADLAFFNERLNRYVVYDGRYGVQISDSASASDVRLGGVVTVRGKLQPVPSVVTANPTMPGDAARRIQSRVMFPVGTTVLPQLTVAMSDDGLYGYATNGHFRKLPKGTSVVYASDRPSVVSVSQRGVIRTVGNGVATITASVVYNGTRRSTSFVIRVLSEVGGLAVDGARLPTFEPDRYSYDVIVPVPKRTPKRPKRSGRSKQKPVFELPAIPRIDASTPDHSARVRISQVRRIPGTANVAVTGPDGIVTTYSVHFARPPISDEFSRSAVGPQWTWLRPDPVDARLISGSLTITAEAGDFTSHTARNVLLQPSLGDWTIQSRLTLSAPPHADTQQAGIIAYQDDGNFLKFDWEYGDGSSRLSVTTTDDLSGTPVSQMVAKLPAVGRLGATVWLRMEKRGQQYTTSWSADGTHFIRLYSVGASLTDVKVGLFAVGGAGTLSDLAVGFDYLRISDSGLTLGSNGTRAVLSTHHVTSIR